ncbi:pre-60S factor rei1 [Coemansia biformis]|uniref:Pre-60S factor rei1 n=1 Tax=Coemansia biformis TaxID=1286918 RepID=A0A9W7YDG3_9FUNG|nr:pre-60S factor rei1 [Coemansia biformis]
MEHGASEAAASVPTNALNMPLFTCIACQVAFYSADQQRTHYRSDWHRYNLKRKVAELPPVTAESFAQRVLAQQAKTVADAQRAGFSAECTVCKKAYSSENGFSNHLSSKKHKENEAKMVRKMQREEDLQAEQSAIEESIATANAAATADVAAAATIVAGAEATDAGGASAGVAADADGATDGLGRKVSAFPVSDDEDEEDAEEDDAEEDEHVVAADSGATEKMDVDQAEAAGDAERARRRQELDIRKELNQATSEEEVVRLLEKKRAAAPRLDPDADCLFCTHKSGSFEANMEHMALAHSLFIPDLEYLVDLRGLIKYLADKISVANVCLFCNGRGRMLHSLEAVRKHMVDKGHTKIAYDTEIDILEISDFYDFSSTYPDAADHEADEMLDADDVLDGASGRTRMAGAGPAQLEEEDGELVLPNGNRIGHRSLQRYYRQTVPAERTEKDSVVIHKMLTSYAEDPEYSTQLTHASRNRALILSQPKGYQAWQVTAKFKEKRAREDFRTRVGIRANGLQKHYREQNPI